ncbi:MAG: LLM class flavin-dependent oxidoreductase, partial [Actinomycetota bacterium]
LTLPLVRRHADWWNCPSYAVERLAQLRPEVGDVRVSVQHPVALVGGAGADAAARDETVATAQRRFGGWGGLLTGTSEELAGQLAKERDVGVDGFVIQLSDFGRPETIGRFGAEVIGALR